MTDSPLPCVISIDPPMSRDLDDAIAAVRDSDGGWTVDVCIPDVPSVVVPGSPTDVSARRMVTSRYRGSFVKDAMLPEDVVNGLSLSPRRSTPMCWFRIALSRDLVVTGISVSTIRHRTAARLTYLEADEALADPASRWHDRLVPLWDLAVALHASRRMRTGAAFDPDNHFYTDEEGMVSHLRAKESHRTHLLVMEIMIMTNAALAAHCAKAGIPIVYRNHVPQDTSSGFRTAVVNELREIEGLDAFAAAERLKGIGARIGRARFETNPGGHWGLDVPAYAWFTSPLRRYCDVVNLRALVHGVADDALTETAAHVQTVTTDLKDRISADHGQRARRAIAGHVISGHAAVLADWDLHTVLRACSENGVIDDLLVTDLRRRLARGVMSGKDVESVFTFGRDVLDPSVVSEVETWLRNDAQRQTMLARDMVERQRIVRIPTLPGGGDDVHGAMLRIAEILEIEWPDAPPATTDRDAVVDAARDHPNPKGALLELATAKGATVTFDDPVRVGADHAPRFTVVARWRLGETRLDERGSASTVKAAAREASWLLLDTLNDDVRVEPVTETKGPVQNAEKHPKNVLLEYAQAHGGRLTFENAVRKGPDHSPSFSVRATYEHVGREIVGTGSGASRKEAEKAAAREIIERMG